MIPKVVCLCPTYHARPASLVGNSIACFVAQTYPADRRRLIVYDDTGHFEPASGEGWELIVGQKRHPTLSAKYNAMVEMAPEADILCVWEDDDIYLPWHIDACVAALEEAPWCHPSYVLSNYTGSIKPEGAAGRFHASLAFRRGALLAIGGWPDTPRGDFDQQLIGRLHNEYGPPANPLDDRGPSYLFRWQTTGCRHGQGFMSSAADETWYDKAGRELPLSIWQVVPAFDLETAGIIESFARR